MDSIITEEQLQATFPYFDNITICRKDHMEHDVDRKLFLEAASRRQIKYNESKSVFSTLNWQFLVPSLKKGISDQILSFFAPYKYAMLIFLEGGCS